MKKNNKYCKVTVGIYLIGYAMKKCKNAKR